MSVDWSIYWTASESLQVLYVIIRAMLNDKFIFEFREKESFALHMTEVTMIFIKKESNWYKNSVSFTDWTRSRLTENILSY
jgi:hypothetical protein